MCWRCQTFLIDPPFLFTAGCLIAFVARRLLVARKPNPFGPSAWVAVGYALFFWASVTWFSFNAPDWMLNYFVPAEMVPMKALHAVFALCLVLAALSGHTITAVFLQRNQTIAAGLTLLSGAIAWGALWVFTIDRYMVVGTYAEYMGGTASPLQESTITGAMNLVGGLQALGAAIPLVFLWRAGQRIKAR